MFELLVKEHLLFLAGEELHYGQEPIENAALEAALNEIETELSNHPNIGQYMTALIRSETKDTVLSDNYLQAGEDFKLLNQEIGAHATERLNGLLRQHFPDHALLIKAQQATPNKETKAAGIE